GSQKLLDHIAALLGPAAMAAEAPRPRSTPIPEANPDDQTVTNSTSSRPVLPAVSPPRRRRAVALGSAILLLATGMIYLAAAPREAPRSVTVSTGPAPEITSPPADAEVLAARVEPTAPAEITIRLELQPEGAIVELDGVRSPGTTLRLPRSEGAHTLVISAPGYETETRSIEARADTLLSLSLRKHESPTRRPVAPASTARAASPTPPPAATEATPPTAKKLKGPVETDL
ncbi:MAG: PEGA domain-containing protein, partial [Byssovorax sp.]